MTDRPTQDAAAVRIFPPGVPLITIIAGVLLDWIIPINSGFEVPPIARYLVGGGIIVGAVALFGFWSVRTMRSTGQSENPYKPTTEIVERGPFRITRNPMYLQMVLVCLGFAILLSNIWVLILTPLCALALHFLVILPEEAYLESKFGADYLEYKRRVRRWI